MKSKDEEKENANAKDSIIEQFMTFEEEYIIVHQSYRIMCWWFNVFDIIYKNVFVCVWVCEIHLYKCINKWIDVLTSGIN